MSDLRDFMDGEARRVRARDDALDGVLRRAERRRTVRRVATGAIALAIAGAGFGLAYGAFRPADLKPGGTGPVPGPTPSATYGPVTNEISARVVKRFVRAFVDARNEFNAERFVEGGARDTYFETSGRAEPASGQIFLYWDGGITEHDIDKLDKRSPTTWTAEVRLELGGFGDCLPWTRVERLRIEGIIIRGGGVPLVVSYVEVVMEDEVLCPPAKSLD
jgi:hypothetical protein